MSAGATKVAPGPVDYLAAVQHPAESFIPAELQSAVFETDPIMGIPVAATGSNAVVFKARIGGRLEALRCYTNMSASSQQRYGALGAHVLTHNLSCVADARLIPDAIAINGDTWPVMRMEWVQGRALDRYVDYLVEEDNRQAIALLAAEWQELVQTLHAAAFAHGDLQHGNVMIDESLRLRLVDLDGVWVPALATSPPPEEVGHPNYQHPSRRLVHRWDRWVDSFSALVIYLSLTAIAVEPGLWDELHDGDNLILKAADFRMPFDTKAWKRLESLHDPCVNDLVAVLQRCCEPGWAENTSLEQLFALPAASESSQTDAGLPWEVKLPAKRPVARASEPSTQSAASLPKPPPVAREQAIARAGPDPVAPGARSPDQWWEESPSSPPPPSPPSAPPAKPSPASRAHAEERRHTLQRQMATWIKATLLGVLGTVWLPGLAALVLTVGLVILLSQYVLYRHWGRQLRE